jgi:hypothetical protein
MNPRDRQSAMKSADDIADQGDIDSMVERLIALDKKPGLKPAEQAFKLAGLVYVAALKLRNKQRWQCVHGCKRENEKRVAQTIVDGGDEKQRGRA